MPDWMPYVFVLGFSLGGIVLIALLLRILFKDFGENDGGEDKDGPSR